MDKNELLRAVPQIGQVNWISVRPQKNDPVQEVDTVVVDVETGIIGDHYAGRSGKRQVTLIQAEHLPVVASILGVPKIDPATLRRNIVVSGLNVLAMRDQKFRIGDEVVLEGTGHCHPCSKMENNLGSGGYHAMRGHGGITARVIQGGAICRGDEIRPIFKEENS
ncbi:MAG: MOSC domain-containing protein [Saprospiraceae bacterium]|nr:MOSC domain-containing protein [Saprospiraceae bacterium]